MRDNIGDLIKKSVDSIEPTDETKERMLANIRKKAEEPVNGIGRADKAQISSIAGRRIRTKAVLTAACLCLVIAVAFSVGLIIKRPSVSPDPESGGTQGTVTDPSGENTTGPDFSENEGTDYDPRGGTSICQIHALLSYHGYSQEMIQLVGEEQFNAWTEESYLPHLVDGCLYPNASILSFIQYFHISREDLESVYFGTSTYYNHVYNLDLLYSGDEKAVDEYYRDIERISLVEEKRSQLFSIKISLRSKYYDEWVELFGTDKISPQTSIYEAVKTFGISRETMEEIVDIYTHKNRPSYDYNYSVLYDGSLDSIPTVEQDAAFCGISDYITE